MEVLQTKEQIVQHYKACIDSVNLINGDKPNGITDEQYTDLIKRNKEHLNIMLSKTFWTTEDLTPIKKAVGLIK